MRDYKNELKQAIESEINADETILWAGRPNPDKMPKAGFYALYIFGTFWTLFSVFWVIAAFMGAVYSSENILFSIFFPLFGVPFVIIGIFILKMPAWLKQDMLNTAYFITSKRAVIIKLSIPPESLVFITKYFTSKNKTVMSFSKNELGSLKKVINADGSGNIVFKTEYSSDNDGGTYTKDVGFLWLDNAADVEKILKEMLDNENNCKTQQLQ